MAWFKCSAELFRTRVAFRLSEPAFVRDSKGVFRINGFIRLLCETSDGVKFNNACELSAKLKLPAKQADMIWNICLEEKVLRKDRGGYSAVEWMIEQGILGEEYADPVRSKQRKVRTKSGEQPAVATEAVATMSDEERFKAEHDGKTKDEWDEMQRWKASPEGKAKMAEYQSRISALMAK